MRGGVGEGVCERAGGGVAGALLGEGESEPVRVRGELGDGVGGAAEGVALGGKRTDDQHGEVGQCGGGAGAVSVRAGASMITVSPARAWVNTPWISSAETWDASG